MKSSIESIVGYSILDQFDFNNDLLFYIFLLLQIHK